MNYKEERASEKPLEGNRSKKSSQEAKEKKETNQTKSDEPSMLTEWCPI